MLYTETESLDAQTCRRIAASVISRAVIDIGGDCEQDAQTALRFLMGDDCAGWLGMLGISAEYARRKPVESLEMKADSGCAVSRQDGGLRSATDAERIAARRALERIKSYAPECEC